MIRRGSALLACLLLVGCKSDPFSAEERAKVSGALEQGLTAWKEGQPAKKWTTKTNPILFDDFEWKQGYRLVEFRVEELRKNAAGLPEARVHLSVISPRGSKSDRQAVYVIVTREGDRLVVGRDPMS